MAAIEYGSDYWCVLLNGGNGSKPEAIHLHADSMKIDAGTLVFTSAGRRPAGTEPKTKEKDSKDKEGKDDMIYFALAPGSWKIVYAANLKDGSPVSVEHWNGGQREQVPAQGETARR